MIEILVDEMLQAAHARESTCACALERITWRLLFLGFVFWHRARACMLLRIYHRLIGSAFVLKNTRVVYAYASCEVSSDVESSTDGGRVSTQLPFHPELL